MDVLKDMVENLSDAVVVIDGNDQIVLFNQEAVRVQRSLSEVPLEVGARFPQGLQIRNQITQSLEIVRSQRTVVRQFAEFPTALGATVSLELRFVPVMDDGKHVRHIYIIAQDLTDRKLFQRKLRSATHDMERVLDQAYAVVISIDSRGYVTGWNRHAAEITGWSKAEMLSHPLSKAMPGESADDSLEVLMSHVRSNRQVSHLNLTFRTRQGREVVVAFSATPRLNARGNVVGATFIGQDVTEHVRSGRPHVSATDDDADTGLITEQLAIKRVSRAVCFTPHKVSSSRT